jgi:hypothetical protein
MKRTSRKRGNPSLDIIGYGDKGRGVQLNQRPIIAWSCGG